MVQYPSAGESRPLQRLSECMATTFVTYASSMNSLLPFRQSNALTCRVKTGANPEGFRRPR